jgi:hypothetical protein
MYEIKRTHARQAFKDLLGQGTHFLITILVGLNGVRDGTIKKDDEFRTVWNPKSTKASAERSRHFALDLSLIRAVDAMDTYFIQARRKPTILPGDGFGAAMDGTGQSVAKRLAVFNNYLPVLSAEENLFLRLAIEWRNRRVHSLADERLSATDINDLRNGSGTLRRNHNGLEIDEVIARYQASEPPLFKDAASVIRSVQDAVKYYDFEILRLLNIEEYVKGILVLTLSPSRASSALRHGVARTWGAPLKREAKVLRILRMAGVHWTAEVEGREIPAALIDRLTQMSEAEALAYLTDC